MSTYSNCTSCYPDQSCVSDPNMDMLQKGISAGIMLPFTMFNMGMNMFNMAMTTAMKTANTIPAYVFKETACCSRTNDHHCHCNHCRSSHTGDTDMLMETKLGETRVLNLLLENNTAANSNFLLKVNYLLGDGGSVIENTDNIISFSEEEGTLAPHECRQIQVRIRVDKPLEAGKCYYADICLSGDCPAEPIELGIAVAKHGHTDYHALCHACRPKTGKAVQFCQPHHYKRHRGSCSDHCTCEVTPPAYYCC